MKIFPTETSTEALDPWECKWPDIVWIDEGDGRGRRQHFTRLNGTFQRTAYQRRVDATLREIAGHRASFYS